MNTNENNWSDTRENKCIHMNTHEYTPLQMNTLEYQTNTNEYKRICMNTTECNSTPMKQVNRNEYKLTHMKTHGFKSEQINPNGYSWIQ